VKEAKSNMTIGQMSRSMAVATSRSAPRLSSNLNSSGSGFVGQRTQQVFFFSTAKNASAPVKSPAARSGVTTTERATLRAARKERATEVLSGAQQASTAGAEAGASNSATSKATISAHNVKYYWYVGLGVPTFLLGWGIYDPTSPPAKLAKAVGLTGYVHTVSDEFARPAHAKLLPDWTDMPNVPHDIPVPHTLVLDLEQTLVSSTWDRKFGWRHAKRPGVDKFLKDMSQYYEIVLYSPSHEGVAAPVVDSLDKTGCIMHRLYRDATYYQDGIHKKDLRALNRNVGRMVVLDDDSFSCVEGSANLVKVKPYNNPHDREDTTLETITPLLLEIAREGYSDIPGMLGQFIVEWDDSSDTDEEYGGLVIEGTQQLGRKVRRMTADEMAAEYQRRLDQMKYDRLQVAQRGLGGLAGAGRGTNRPAPELLPQDPSMPSSSPEGTGLTSKELVGAAPPSSGAMGSDVENAAGVMGWLKRRQENQAEEQARKMEKWNEVMMRKQLAKKEEAENRARAAA
jgi:import inner membrane translocase subunit TIM50